MFTYHKYINVPFQFIYLLIILISFISFEGVVG